MSDEMKKMGIIGTLFTFGSIVVLAIALRYV